MEVIVTAMEAVQLTVVVAAAKMAMGREWPASCLLCLVSKKWVWREVERSQGRSKIQAAWNSTEMMAAQRVAMEERG